MISIRFCSPGFFSPVEMTNTVSICPYYYRRRIELKYVEFLRGVGQRP
jgi:hypothetical protein